MAERNHPEKRALGTGKGTRRRSRGVERTAGRSAKGEDGDDGALVRTSRVGWSTTRGGPEWPGKG